MNIDQIQNTFTTIVLAISAVVFFILILAIDRSGISKIIFFKRKVDKDAVDIPSEALKTLSLMVLVLFWLVPRCRVIFTGLSILLPLLLLFRYIRKSDVLHIRTQEQYVAVPSRIVWTVAFPSASFFFLNHDILGKLLFSPVAQLFIAVFSVALIVPFFVFSVEYKEYASVGIGFCILAVMFAWAVACQINTTFDFAEPTQYAVTVTDKFYTNSKSGTGDTDTTSYHVFLSKWGNHAYDTHLYVGPSEYDEYIVGETLVIWEHPGLLRVSWWRFAGDPWAPRG